METAKIMNTVGELNPTSNWVFKNYKAYTLVRAIAKYSSNTGCSSKALKLLDLSDRDVHSDLAEDIQRMAGGFMSAVYDGNFNLAWTRADGCNKSTLWTALGNDEIEL